MWRHSAKRIGQGGVNLDVWLVPPDWRHGTELDQGRMEDIADIKNDSNTRTFLRSIARVAQPLA